jgi:hypothetical protein
MAGYFPYELDELLESPELEGFEEYEESDDEARRRPRPGLRRPPVRTAKRGGAVPQRPSPGFATKAELAATANRLDGRIGVNSTAIKTVEGRTNTLTAEQAKLRTDVNKLQGSINDVRNMAMLMPLLSSQKTRAVTTPPAGTELQSGDKVVVDAGDSFSKMLPMLMFSGSFGGSSGGGHSGGMFGGDGGGMMMAMMMMAMHNK